MLDSSDDWASGFSKKVVVLGVGCAVCNAQCGVAALLAICCTSSSTHDVCSSCDFIRDKGSPAHLLSASSCVKAKENSNDCSSVMRMLRANEEGK